MKRAFRNAHRNRPRHGHDFDLMGGAGGWEVWECMRCGRSTIPVVFFLWPELLGTFFKRFRCPAAPHEQEGEMDR